MRKWQAENKDKLKEYRENRYFTKNHDISNEELALLYDFSGSSCMYCGMSEEESLEMYKQKLHRDHAINYGSNGIENCILACKSCNSTKNDKDWDEWYLKADCFNEERYRLIVEWLEIIG